MKLDNKAASAKQDSKVKKELKTIQKALLTGTSYMMPIVVAGGVLFALGLIGGTPTDTGMEVANPFMGNIKMLGSAGLFMMIPILCAYIAYSVAGRPGLVPGFILGYICNTPVNNESVKTGFVGALIMGLAAGYFIRWMKSWNVNKYFKPIMPILIMPIVSVLVLGLLYVYVINGPVCWLVTVLMNFLEGLNGTNGLLFAIVLGAICEIDMGGPITKSVSMFTMALIAEGICGPNAMFRVCCGIPPMAICLSTFLFKNKWSQADRDAAEASGIMGIMGITEGAIPFAVQSPKIIIGSNIVGCIVGSVIAYLLNVQSPVPHGSFITLPMVTNKLGFTIAILAGVLVEAIMIGLWKKTVPVTEKPKRSAPVKDQPKQA